ncbi:MAG: DUF2064 domain-containing protein [Marmoricola sp.]
MNADSNTSLAASPVVLVMAKAPVAGLVKTRLGQVIGMEEAAELAAAALLDTFAACIEAYGVPRCHLALDGELAVAHRAEELLAATRGWIVHPQRGDSFAERLVNAHHDTAAAALAPIVQIGMDTPQLTAAALEEAAALLVGPDDAVLGPAEDGGWWLLGVGGPHLLAHLTEVPMSTEETCQHTRDALIRAGARVREIGVLRDVDEHEDARLVADAAKGSHFAKALELMSS